jgi:RCC1 and BTB domain-containing protein
MINITNWTVLHKLKPQFVSSIKFFNISGENGSEVMIVTKDDDVFSFGNNKNGLLGLELDIIYENPTIVSELCDKQLIDIKTGNKHAIALSKSGSCYSWGHNDCGQLGSGTIKNVFIPHSIEYPFEDSIIEVCCGHKHSLALTKTGKLYAWGSNYYGQIGNKSFANQLSPIDINFFDNQKIVSICCGYGHSMALTENGVVYGWGYNSFGQLGIGNDYNHNIPTKITSSEGVIFLKIACGPHHSLILSTVGDLYAFGYNTCGQIGNGNTKNQIIPVKVNNYEKFVDIACVSKLSVALSENKLCYFWGECNNENISSPKETPLESIHDIFAIYSKRRITYKPIHSIDKPSNDKISQRINKTFNDPKYSDLNFKIEDKFIYVNKSVLRICSKYFETMFSENWSESKTNSIEITEYSYSVYYSFLKYVYSDCVDIKPKELIDLYDLANCYLEEELKLKCLKMMTNEISVQNVCTFYTFAINYDSKDLVKFCIKFSKSNRNEVLSTKTFLDMDIVLRKKFTLNITE